MSERGVFAVSRGIWDDPDYADEPFTEREAMMWLAGSAAWSDRSVRGLSGPVSLARGEFCFSVRFLAEKWQWSKSRVGRYLNRAVKRDTLRVSERDGATVYFIKNYNKYQVLWLPDRDSKRDKSRDASGTAAGQQRDKEEEPIKQDNRDNSKELSETPVSILMEALDEEHAKEVVSYRKRRKQSNSTIALRRLVTKLNMWSNPNEAAAEMILRGWKGFDPEWMKGRGTGPPQTRTRDAGMRLMQRHGVFDGIDGRQSDGGTIGDGVRGELPKPAT